MIRFEDLLFSQEDVAREICDCVDGEWFAGEFSVVEKSAKGDTGAHHEANGRQEAVERYGNKKLREEGFNRVDLEYVEVEASERLKEIFMYK